MQFLVETTPQPAHPDTVREHQLALWRWLDTLRDDGTVLQAWRKPGRGAVMVVNVPDHDTLHAILQVWSQHVPATFSCTPLLAPPPGAWP